MRDYCGSLLNCGEIVKFNVNIHQVDEYISSKSEGVVFLLMRTISFVSIVDISSAHGPHQAMMLLKWS